MPAIEPSVVLGVLGGGLIVGGAWRKLRLRVHAGTSAGRFFTISVEVDSSHDHKDPPGAPGGPHDQAS